ncbi:hypothetical protein M378DRAFT_155000 [Amanita muscaria Koide BX008]|uniref:Uncharacterized protein n=1 Tax=Amanita muscaria (strain Koide BX008) TaxID=946122 RepID=A0A0C2TVR2_AMAMK|nr:hypothetical protein M378DRAFT_155000 [Amanita muscaria Koide BX008]
MAQVLSLSVRNKNINNNGKGSGSGNSPGNPGNGNSPGNPGNGNSKGNGKGKGNPGGTVTSNPSPSTTPVTPSPSPTDTGSGGGTSVGASSGNGGGSTTSSDSGSSPSPNIGGNGSTPTSPPGSSPTATDAGGNGSSPPNRGSGGDNTSPQSGPQPSSGDTLPTNGASNDSAGSHTTSSKTDAISDSSPGYHTTFSPSTYTSVFTGVTTISSDGQAFTSSFIFTSIGLTTIPVSGPTGVPGGSGVTTHQPNTGVIAGAVVGSVAGLFLLLLLIFLCRRRGRDDVSFSMVNPLMEEAGDEQEARLTPSSIQINMSHVTETDYSKYGGPPSPLASLFNKARHRSSQPFFRPSFHDRRIPTQQTSTAENPFRDYSTPPPVTITNPFADPASDADVSGSGETSSESRLSTFTDISSMLFRSNDSGAAVEVSNSTAALRQRNEAMLSEAPATRSSEAVIEMARRLSEIPVLDISNTAAHARKSSELIPDMLSTTPGPSRTNSTHREAQNLGSSRVTELYGVYPSEQSRRSSRADNRYSKTSSNRSIRWGFAS